MGAAASVIEEKMPDEFSEAMCKELTGKCFDERLFHCNATNAVISKSRLAQIVADRTDCFLTHDWGKELGQDNHARVALINAALQKRGMKTWFDAEQMQGNIKKQMISGIDNSQCIVVFITQRYIMKVAGQNAEDNCQLEFNYASRTKTASRMVAVVMEERMRNANMWQGEVGMVLGGSLYVDMCGDLSDEEYLSAKADELEKAILRVIGTPVAKFGWFADAMKSTPFDSTTVIKANNPMTVSSAAASGAADAVPLESLSVQDVSSLLQSLSLGAYVQELAKNDIDGKCLAACESVEDVKEIGITMNVKAKLLFGFITTALNVGVSKEHLQGSQASTPASAAGLPTAPATDSSGITDRVSVLVQELNEGALDVKAQAARELFDMATVSAENRAMIAAAGAIPPLIHLLQQGGANEQIQAAAALKWLAIEGENKTTIAAAGAIPVLVQLLDSDTAGVVEQAADALKQLAVDAENKKIIAAVGAIPLLVKLLSHDTAGVVEQAADAIMILAVDAANQKSIAVAGAIPLLVLLLSRGSPGASKGALSALQWLAVDFENKKIIAAAEGAIPLLVQLLTSDISMTVEQAADVLKQLAVDAENKKIVAEAGAIPLLVQVSKTGAGGAAQQAVDALRQLAVDEENRKTIIAAGVVL